MLAIFDDAALSRTRWLSRRRWRKPRRECGVIPKTAADAIAEAARTLKLDTAALAEAAAHAGTLAIPLVKELGRRVAAIDTAAAGHVHFGGTSQDLADTALVLQLGDACTLLERDLARLARRWRRSPHGIAQR